MNIWVRRFVSFTTSSKYSGDEGAFGLCFMVVEMNYSCRVSVSRG